MGKVGSPILGLGQWPGEEENKVGIPMQGAGGRATHHAITRISLIPWDMCFFSNVLGCTAETSKTAKFMKTCAPRVYELVEIVQPKIILSMGLVAGNFLAGTKVSMGKLARTVRDFAGVPTYFATHPLEPERREGWRAKRDSRRRVEEDFLMFRNVCVEMGIIKREVE